VPWLLADGSNEHMASELVHIGEKKTGTREGSSPCCGVPCGENEDDDAEMAKIDGGRRYEKEAGA
jgi:hypothetical protein